MLTKTLRDISIRWKLIVMITVVSGMSLCAATVAFIAVDWVSTKEATVRRLEVVAGVGGDNAVSALAFDDSHAAEEALEALRSESHIVAACVFSASGDVFARYHRDGLNFTAPPPAETSHRFGESQLEFYYTVIYQEERFGSIYI